MQFHLMQFICSFQALAWNLEGMGVNKNFLVLACMVLIVRWTFREPAEWLALFKGCPLGDSRTACVWAGNPKTRFWEKKPTSVEGGRLNFAFHSGKWGRT